MLGELIKSTKGCYIRAILGGEQFQSTKDFLDFVVAYAVPGCTNVLLNQSDLAADFFDLKSGFAGELMQKCSTYHIRLAVVVDFDNIVSERFHELMYESNKGNLVHFYSDTEAAIHWLVGQ